MLGSNQCLLLVPITFYGRAKPMHGPNMAIVGSAAGRILRESHSQRQHCLVPLIKVCLEEMDTVNNRGLCQDVRKLPYFSLGAP